MTKEEAAIITAYTGILIGKFDSFHEYAEKIKGHPIFTICFTDPEYWVELKRLSEKDFFQLNENIQ